MQPAMGELPQKIDPNRPSRVTFATQVPTKMADRKSPKTSLMRISQAATAADVSTQTVEYYIMLGLISPIRLPDKRGRYFDGKLVRRIKLVRRLNQSGYTLRDIRETYLKNR